MYDRCHIADGCEADEACQALCPEGRCTWCGGRMHFTKVMTGRRLKEDGWKTELAQVYACMDCDRIRA